MVLSITMVNFLVFGILATIQLAQQTPVVIPSNIQSESFDIITTIDELKNRISALTDAAAAEVNEAAVGTIENYNIKSFNILNDDIPADTDADTSVYENEKILDTKNWIKTPGTQLIESIPMEDRADFILYHLSEALNAYSIQPKIEVRLPREADIPIEKYLKFKNMTTYDEFSKNLLSWTKVVLGTNNVGVHEFVMTKRACPPWGCFDPNDIGQMCCPF